MAHRILISSLAVASLLTGGSACAQRTTSAPVTDSAAQASPVQAAPKAPVDDSAANASPEIGPALKRGASIPSGAAIHAVLLRGIDSGSLKNGQSVSARLSAPLKTTGGTLPVGTPVTITVIANVPAGEMIAVGEFSLQVVRVGRVETFTDVKTFRGVPGRREVADAAPAIGTNAGLAAGADVEFTVSKPATAAVAPPADGKETPGSVNAIAKGSPGKTTGGSNSGEPTYGGDRSLLTPAPPTPTAANQPGANQSSAPTGMRQSGTMQSR